MAWKILRLINGIKTEFEALVTSAGAGDSGKIPALDAAGRLDSSFMPIGTAVEKKVVAASENLSAGDFVNLHLVSGALKVRKADGTAIAKKADGFVIAAVTSGNNADVFYGNVNTGVTGLTIADEQWLSTTTPGGVQNTPPTGAGNISQRVGKATATTEILVELETPTVLA